jgi:type I restriction-modification system DNA methylase subunit
MGLQNGNQIYLRLCELFRFADEKYNSGLFHFQEEKNIAEPPDDLTLKLKIDDEPLKDIIKRLYYPESPYEFSIISADILGQVYEQFLGKVIRLTAGHRAMVEEKPEVRKAGGIYYTPSYIVDYIVKNTVGKLLEGKNPKQISKIKVLDPACGSGHFLIGAYQYLLDWYLDWYVKDGAKKWAIKKSPILYQDTHGEWRLTTAERKRILLNNIYGVDIDPQAVEVTKLSLLLKVLEGETEQTLNTTLRIFHERALPDLGSNVKCGNSLIGPDFYENQQVSMFDKEERYQINAFDWKKEFSEIMKTGGFDVVIGNPPWGADIEAKQRKYLSNSFPEVADYESSQYFILKSIFLVNPNGLVGMIAPNTLALNIFAKKWRDRILELSSFHAILDISDADVFAGPGVRSMIFIVGRKIKTDCSIFKSTNIYKEINRLREVPQKALVGQDTWAHLFIKETHLSKIINNISAACVSLADYCDVKQGYIPYRTTTLTRKYGTLKAKEIVSKRSWHAFSKKGTYYQKELQGADVNRYALNWSGVWVKYGEWVSTYLPISVFSGPRILVREITGKIPHLLLATYTEDTFVHNPSILAVLPRDKKITLKVILGILNSKLMSVIFSQVAPKAKKGLFPKIIITDAKRLLLPANINQSLAENKILHQLNTLVDCMLDMSKETNRLNAPHEKETLRRQIDATDRQIDQIVYKLYGLTPEEIKIVEEGSNNGQR